MNTNNTTENYDSLFDSVLENIFGNKCTPAFTDARIDMEHRFHVVQDVRQRAIAWKYNHYDTPLAPLDDVATHYIECVPSDVLASQNRVELSAEDRVRLDRVFMKLPRDGFILVPDYNVYRACKSLFPESKVGMFLFGDSGCAVYEIDGEVEMDLPSTSWAVPIVSIRFGRRTRYIPAFTIEIDEEEE